MNATTKQKNAKRRTIQCRGSGEFQVAGDPPQPGTVCLIFSPLDVLVSCRSSLRSKEAAGFEPARRAKHVPRSSSPVPAPNGVRASSDTTAGFEPASPALQAGASPLGHVVVAPSVGHGSGRIRTFRATEPPTGIPGRRPAPVGPALPTNSHSQRMEQDSNLQGAVKARPFSTRLPRTGGASPSERFPAPRTGLEPVLTP
jgi:hypothetical protein